MALLDYRVTISVGDRSIEINDKIDTNYKPGEAVQLANLFYRAMLANGFTPFDAAAAMEKISMASGFAQQYDAKE